MCNTRRRRCGLTRMGSERGYQEAELLVKQNMEGGEWSVSAGKTCV